MRKREKKWYDHFWYRKRYTVRFTLHQQVNFLFPLRSLLLPSRTHLIRCRICIRKTRSTLQSLASMDRNELQFRIESIGTTTRGLFVCFFFGSFISFGEFDGDEIRSKKGTIFIRIIETSSVRLEQVAIERESLDEMECAKYRIKADCRL